MTDILLDFVPFERVLQVGWQQDWKMWVSVDGTLCSDSGLSTARCLGLGQTCPSNEGKKRTGKKITKIQFIMLKLQHKYKLLWLIDFGVSALTSSKEHLPAASTV